MYPDGPAEQTAPFAESSDELLARLFDRRAAPPPAPLRRARRRRRPPWMAPATLAALVALALVLILTWGASPGPRPTPTTASAPTAVQLRDESRLRSATTTLNAAGTVVTNGFAAVTGVPTAASLSTLTTPYQVALEVYQGVLDQVSLPARLSAVARAVRVEVRHFIAYLSALDRTTPGHLSGWLSGFNLHAAELQTAVVGLQADLA